MSDLTDAEFNRMVIQNQNGIGFELAEEPQLRARQLRNMKSNVRYYKKKIAEIERLIAQRDKK